MYLNTLLLSRYRSGKKWQTVNGDYSAMRKFYEHVLGQEWDVEHLPRPRKERSLPGIVSTQEVERLISHGRTLKHQVFMVLLYGTGLRLSEALNLRIVDIDGQREQLRVVKGKGAKGR
ncbi:MAG: tyrosine-type recombinase/integrase, partial [Bacteroidetes bacterium]|nr:tyrosine-type recombinase/integrase [Bacteroidota bacterium]